MTVRKVLKEWNCRWFIKRFGLSPSSVYEISEPRCTKKNLYPCTLTKSTCAKYKVNNGLLEHMKTIVLARVCVVSARNEVSRNQTSAGRSKTSHRGVELVYLVPREIPPACEQSGSCPNLSATLHPRCESKEITHKTLQGLPKPIRRIPQLSGI